MIEYGLADIDGKELTVKGYKRLPLSEDMQFKFDNKESFVIYYILRFENGKVKRFLLPFPRGLAKGETASIYESRNFEEWFKDIKESDDA